MIELGKKYKVKRYGYEWGGQRKQRVKRGILAVAILCVAGIAGWFAFDPIYKMVTNFELPGKSSSSTPQSESSSVASEVQNSVSTEPEGPPEEQKRVMQGKSYFIATSDLMDQNTLASSLQKMKSLGAENVVFDLKDEKGKVQYTSSSQSVLNNLALAEQTYDLNSVVAAIQNAGLTPIGRLFTFKDCTSTASMNEAAVKYMDSKVNWIDDAKANGGKAWLNPNSQMAQDYILGLIDETTKAGLQVVVLDGMQFPEGYSLEFANYGAGNVDKSTVLAEFYNKAMLTAEKNHATVIPVIRADAAVGINQIPYGKDLSKIISKAEVCLLDVSPAIFGNGVTTEIFTLTKPILNPYETVKTVLDTAKPLMEQSESVFTLMIQAYSHVQKDGTVPVPYGQTEVQAQVKAAAEAGIEDIFFYNPQGYLE